MKKVKTVLVVFMALVIAVSAVACGSATDYTKYSLADFRKVDFSKQTIKYQFLNEGMMGNTVMNLYESGTLCLKQYYNIHLDEPIYGISDLVDIITYYGYWKENKDGTMELQLIIDYEDEARDWHPSFEEGSVTAGTDVLYTASFVPHNASNKMETRGMAQELTCNGTIVFKTFDEAEAKYMS